MQRDYYNEALRPNLPVALTLYFDIKDDTKKFKCTDLLGYLVIIKWLPRQSFRST
jgi:hypothetical protein